MQFLQDVFWPEGTVSSKSSHSIRPGALNASTHHCTSDWSLSFHFVLWSAVYCAVGPLQHSDSFVQMQAANSIYIYQLSCLAILICLYLLLVHVISPPRSICSTCRLWIRGPRRPTWSTGSTPTATLAVTGTTDTPTDDGEDRGHHKPPLPLQTTNATPCTYRATWRLQHRA